MFDSTKINGLLSVTKHFKQDQKFFIMMAKKDKIDFVYNTSALEGNATFTLSKEILCKLHVKVVQEKALSWGTFRSAHVNIGGTDYIPPKFQDLDAIFEEGIKAVKLIHDPILKALSYFLFGARTQFFFDGNKRVSRLMMNGIMLHAGLPILNIKAKDRLEFNSKMST